MSDESQLVELQKPEPEDEPLFRNKQLEYVPQVGNPAISNGQSRITFTFQDVKDHFISLKDAWISIPVTVTYASADANATTNHMYAVKQSLLSLVNSVRVTTVNNASILDYEKDLQISANLRLLLENNPDYLRSIASMIQFDKDYPHENAEIDSYTGNNLQNPEQKEYTSGGDANVRNPNHNLGFMKRRKFLLEDLASRVTTDVKFIAKIPLKLIHDFFFQLDFPIYYPNIKIEFEFNVGASSFKPICRGQLAGGTVDKAYTASLTTGQEPKLYYHRVEIPDELGASIAQKVEDGFEKVIKYRKYNVVDRKPTGGVNEYDISTDSTSTRRIFGLLYPAAAVGAANIVDGDAYPSPLLTVGKLEDANCWIHKQRQFDRDISGDAERWAHLSAEFPFSDSNDGPIDYNEFVKRYNILCMNVTRKQNLLNKDSSTTVRVKATPSTAGEIQWIVEEERLLKLKYGSKGLTRVLDGPSIKA